MRRKISKKSSCEHTSRRTANNARACGDARDPGTRTRIEPRLLVCTVTPEPTLSDRNCTSPAVDSPSGVVASSLHNKCVPMQSASVPSTHTTSVSNIPSPLRVPETPIADVPSIAPLALCPPGASASTYSPHTRCAALSDTKIISRPFSSCAKLYVAASAAKSSPTPSLQRRSARLTNSGTASLNSVSLRAGTSVIVQSSSARRECA
mmetsp:Transcript_4165/g.16036  ORF Transcript_4165/g.16036 Transcript_4165/m.16036 type:complete len:207 (+) Transcript_4165:3605-4225(+)